jgi:hypothetical protein
MRNDEGNALGWHVPAFQAEERAAGYAQKASRIFSVRREVAVAAATLFLTG